MIDWAYIWFIAFVLLSLFEIITPQFITIWFAIACLLIIPLALLGLSFQVQIVVFVILSVVLLIATRPLYKKYIKKRIVATNADALINQTAIVIEDINNDESVGLVKTKGQIWSARSFDNTCIKANEKVIILSIEGVKLIVKKYLMNEKE